MENDVNSTEGAPELGQLQGWLDYAINVSRKSLWECFVIDQFLKGNHSIKGSPSDNSIVISRKEKENFPINKMYSNFRAIKGYITRHNPFIQIDVEDDPSEESKTYARRGNKVLSRDNKLNQFRKINKEWVHYAVRDGIAYRQIGFDAKRQCAIRWTVPRTELLIGSKTGELEDAPFVIKPFKRTIGYYRKKYPKTGMDVVADNKLAATEFQELAQKIELGGDIAIDSGSEEYQTAIGYECWYRVFKPNSLKGTINKVVFTLSKVLDHDETPLNEYPFVPYKVDIAPDDANGESHLKHLIAPQRMINMLNSQMLEYNVVVNKGRYIIPDDAGFSLVLTENGQIIRTKKNVPVTSLPIPPANPLLERQLNMAQDFFDELGNRNDASKGAVPNRVSSGDAIEALQSADANNIMDYRENFEDALALEAQWILKMYSMFMPETLVLTNDMGNGETESFVATGKVARENTNRPLTDKYYAEEYGDYLDVCAILPDNNVKASATSQLGETKEAKLNLLFKLYDAGIIPGKLVLEHLEFPNISNLTERLAEEALAELQLQMMKQSMTPNPGMQPPMQPPAQPNANMPENLTDSANGQLIQALMGNNSEDVTQMLTQARDSLQGMING